MAKILLLEDDANLNETISEFLEDEGHEVISTYDGEEAQERLYETQFDLLLLDINVPKIDGRSLLKESRQSGVEAPAIFITSMDSIDDLERGFESGCDDYIRKPFVLKELKIRVETLLKRSFFHEVEEYKRINEKTLYDIKKSTLLINNEAINLGNKESLLLKLFMTKEGSILSHEVLYDYLWDYHETPSDTALRTYIKNLRKLIGKEHIVSIKKQGYKFVTQK